MINIFQKSGDTIILVGRDNEKNRTMEEIKHIPYFYVKDINGKYQSVFGDRLKKIEVNSSYEVKKEREKYDETFESDILFINRILIDRVENIGEDEFRVCYLDIENAGSLDRVNTPVPITCICCYDNFSETQYGFIWHPDEKPRKEVTKSGEGIERKTYYFNNERSMLNKFIRFICDFDFDLFCGWNSNGFDWPYIINRCRLLGVNVDLISMHGKVEAEEFDPFWRITINGRYSFDLLQGYKTDLTFSQMDSYRLNSVAQKELKDKKIEVEGDWENLWDKDRKLLLDYCYKDVMLCVWLDEKRNIINYYNTKRRIIGCQWDDLFNATRFHDILFLREAKKLGLVLPKKVKNKRERYGGGFVDNPPVGLHEGVFVLDLKSLYPNIIRTWNLSPEMLDPSGDIKINGLILDKSKKGICPIICEKLLEERERLKKEMKKYQKGTIEYDSYYAQQYAVKVAANSLYGALGNPYFRMFKQEIAATVTWAGREIIKYSKEVAEKLGFDVIYGDTDSIFVKIPEEVDGDYDKAMKVATELAEKLTESYNEFVNKFGVDNHTLLMQFEKIFSKIFFGVKDTGGAAKKRYMGYIVEKDKEGNWNKSLKIMGFETKRADTAKIEQEALKNIFKIILDNGTKEDVERYVENLKMEMIEGKYPLRNIAIRRSVKKTNRSDIYTEAFKYGNKYLGCKFQPGDRIKMLFVKYIPELPQPPRGTIAFERDDQVPKGIIINWNKMFERIFDTKLERIFRAMGWKHSKNNEMGQVKLF